MKKAMTILFLFILALAVKAQDEKKFSPEKFDAELQLFIINEAKLTPQEAAKFFPVYKEMQSKQRSLYDRQRNLVTMTPNDEASCLKAIKERDEIELELKRIQQSYHERFLEVMSASKVYATLKAEDKFYRRVFRRFNRNRPQFDWPQMQRRHNNNQK